MTEFIIDSTDAIAEIDRLIAVEEDALAAWTDRFDEHGGLLYGVGYDQGIVAGLRQARGVLSPDDLPARTVDWAGRRHAAEDGCEDEYESVGGGLERVVVLDARD